MAVATRRVTKPKAAPDTSERARRATSNFRRMQPILSGFARTLTKRADVRVEMRSGTPCTDGKVIYLRPPIELGDVHVHDKRLCDTRDENSVPRCTACRSHEDVMITLYHEIAHIAFGSFENVSDADRAEIVARAVAEHGAADGSTRAGKIAKRIEANEHRAKSYIGAAGLVSPFLPGIVNALEDVRVNREMYRTRPGTLAMFKGQAHRVFTEGIQLDDGTFSEWKDAPRNAQAVVGLFAKAAGYDYTDWFSDEVVDALNDEELTRLCRRLDGVRSARGIYELAFPVLERLRGLGYCKAPDDPEDDEPEPEEEPAPAEADPDHEDTGDDSNDEGADKPEPVEPADKPEPGADKPEPGADDDDEPAGAPQEPDDDDDEPGAGSDDDDEPADDLDESSGVSGDGAESDSSGGSNLPPEDGDEPVAEPEPVDDSDLVERALKVFGQHDEPVEPPENDPTTIAVDKAIVQEEHFDDPSGPIFGVRIHEYDKRASDPTAEAWNTYETNGYRRSVCGVDMEKTTPESILGPSLLRMRVAFADNRKSADRRNLKAGKVDSRVLGKRIATGDDRLMRKTDRPGKKDYFVLIGFDISGSTAGSTLTEIKQAVLAQAELCHRAGVKFAVYAHTGNVHDPDSSTYRGTEGWLDLDIYVIKHEHEKWTDSTRERLFNLGPSACNLDGHTLEFYRKRCDQSTATNKVILYYTDGEMPAENYGEELTVLTREIAACKRRGYTLLGVGVGTDSPIRHGLDTARYDSPTDLPRVIRHLEKRLTGK